MTLFLDTDGSAYLISSAAVNSDLNIYRLNSSFTNVASLVKVLAGYHREAPAVFKRNGVYFLITSGATGWNPNRASYQTSSSMAGNWTAPVGFGDNRTYNSQSTYVLPVQGTSGTSYLYIGDRWGPATGQLPNDSTYVWLPLSFPSNTSVGMTGSSLVNINVAAGTVSNVTSGSQFVRIRSNDSGRCANVANDALNYDATLVQWTCGTARNETVETRSIAGGYSQYVVQHSGLCLARNANDDRLVQTTCGIGSRAQWTRTGTRIVNRATGRCLNVSGASKENGAALQTWTCGNEPNSQWTLVP